MNIDRPRPTDIALAAARAHINAALADGADPVLDYPGEAPAWFERLDRGAHIAHALHLLAFANGVGRTADRATLGQTQADILAGLDEPFTFDEARDALEAIEPIRGDQLYRLLVRLGYRQTTRGRLEQWFRPS